ncbi:MAG: hypothetical protein K940chlam2_00487 [Chlamydiae bacterium]|nr:hypothetical protein [Chlamydiota bacterium]
MNRGVIVASDERSEWLLPWWWARYSARNTLPVCLIDLGLSHFGRTFCKERGTLLALDGAVSCAAKDQISKEQAAHWEAIYGKELWEMRSAWFKKPHALCQTPFKKTLWLDLDCEVLLPLEPLFENHQNDSFVIASETESAFLAEGEPLYNSGVILYERTDPILEAWRAASLLKSGEAWGDQQLLSRIISEEQFPITLLDERYNWRMARGLNIHAAIIHWVGSWGKEYIRKHGGLADDLAEISPPRSAT